MTARKLSYLQKTARFAHRGLTLLLVSVTGCLFHNLASGQEGNRGSESVNRSKQTPTNTSAQQVTVFSGPQVAEKLADFEVRYARGDAEGESLSVMKAAGDAPVLILFWNQLSRPAYAVINRVSQYALDKKESGLHTTLVILSEDLRGDSFMGAVNRFPKEMAVTTAADGREGPGSYGLNRNVALTVLIGKKRKVTANFALVQPSVQSDVPKILQALAETLGEEPPKMENLEAEMREMNRSRTNSDAANSQTDPKLLKLFRSLIRKSATAEEVATTAEELEEYAKSKPSVQKDMGRRASRIVDSGLLKNYGTEAAQGIIRGWAKKYGERQTADEDSSDSK